MKDVPMCPVAAIHHPPAHRHRAYQKSPSSSSSTVSLSLDGEAGGQVSNRFVRLLNKTKEWKARYRIRSHTSEDWDAPSPAGDMCMADGFLLNSSSRRRVFHSHSTTTHSTRNTNNTLIGTSPPKTPESFASDLTSVTDDSSSSHGDRILEDLFKLLHSKDPEIGQKTLTTIFHLAQSSISTRNRILEAGGLSPILQQIQRDGPAELATAGAIYHLTAGDPAPPFHLVTSAIPLLLNLIYTSDEAQVVIISCFVIFELSTIEDPTALDYINTIVPLEAHSRLTGLLNHPNIDVRFRALQIINKITQADRVHGSQESLSQCKESLVTCRFLATLKRCLNTPEMQSLCLELVQNLLVNHHALIIAVYPEILRVYFKVVRDKIGFEYRVISSLLPALRDASPEEVIYLNELGGADIAGECLVECEKLAACLGELKLLKEQYSF